MIRIGPPADRPLPGGTINRGCFRPITARNTSVTVDFDRRCPLSGGINLVAAPPSLDDPVPASPHPSSNVADEEKPR
ncbi:hypothetical protein GW17_00012770 [Ensete ventricosum]|nr:hypothetical protein GW17_00012770 [Ensete ventricosum]